MANEGYHEPVEELSDATRDMHRAITSLMEELEAIDWYNQRVDACKDAALKALGRLHDHNVLCHGDFALNNILLRPQGPIIIDRNNATQGNALADVARTLLYSHFGFAGRFNLVNRKDKCQ